MLQKHKKTCMTDECRLCTGAGQIKGCKFFEVNFDEFFQINA